MVVFLHIQVPNNDSLASTLITVEASDRGLWGDIDSGLTIMRSMGLDWIPGFGTTLDGAQLVSDMANDKVNPIDDFFLSGVRHILYAIMAFFGLFTAIGAGIFSYAIDPAHISGNEGLLNNDAIKNGWAFIRDFFNIFFILALLFSAFATIFQVEKFHLKRTLLMIILMALLVNFSWPIARVIMDIGNVTMYFFAENLFPSVSSGNGGNILTTFGKWSGVANVIVPNNIDTYSITYLLAGIVFTFLFAVTIMAIAMIMLVRVIALALLLVFAPIGFVLLILPSTSSYAHDWWNALFKWTFIGPIMLFMLALAIGMMSQLGNTTGADISITGAKGRTYVAEMGAYIVPIVIMWSALIVGQKMGGSFAGIIVNRASSAAKWGGKMVSKGTWGLTKAGGRGLGRATRTQGMVGAIKQKWDQSVVAPGQTAKSSNTAKWSARMGVKGAQAKDIQNRASQYDKDNLGNDDLQSRANKGDAAAVLALAKRGQLEEIPATVIAQMNADPGVEGLLSGEIKKKRVDLIIATKYEQAVQKEMTNNGGNRSAAESSIDLTDIERKEFGKLDAEKLASQDWHSIRGDITKPPSDSARRLVQVAKKASPQAQTEMAKRMSAGDFATYNEISSHP